MANDINTSRSAPASNDRSYHGDGPGKVGVDSRNPAPARDAISSDRTPDAETHGSEDGDKRPS